MSTKNLKVNTNFPILFWCFFVAPDWGQRGCAGHWEGLRLGQKGDPKSRARRRGTTFKYFKSIAGDLMSDCCFRFSFHAVQKFSKSFLSLVVPRLLGTLSSTPPRLLDMSSKELLIPAMPWVPSPMTSSTPSGRSWPERKTPTITVRRNNFNVLTVGMAGPLVCVCAPCANSRLANSSFQHIIHF